MVKLLSIKKIRVHSEEMMLGMRRRLECSENGRSAEKGRNDTRL